MPAGLYPPLASLYQERIIETQDRARGPADRRQTNDIDSIGAPGKVVEPILLAWIEERDCLVGERIYSVGPYTFVTITQVACQPQILNVRTPSHCDGDNVLNMQFFGGEASSCQTVTTSALSLFLNLPPNILRNIRTLGRRVKLLNEERVTTFSQQSECSCLAKQNPAVLCPQCSKLFCFFIGQRAHIL